MLEAKDQLLQKEAWLNTAGQKSYAKTPTPPAFQPISQCNSPPGVVLPLGQCSSPPETLIPLYKVSPPCPRLVKSLPLVDNAHIKVSLTQNMKCQCHK